MRGFRSTLILLVVFLGLLAYIYFVESKRTPGGEVETKPKLFTVEADKITELSVKLASGEQSILKKADGKWTFVQPAPVPVDEPSVTSIASSLATAEIQRVVDEAPANLAQYGLAQPKVELGFKTESGESRQLLIGEKTATGGDLYVKLPGEKRVLLIPGYLESTFNKTPFDLRDKTILKFERDKVDAIEVDAEGTTSDLRFEKSGETWRITRPVVARADTASVESIVGRLQSAQMKALLGQDPAKQKEYGLDKPAVTVTLGAGTGRHQLFFGKEGPDSTVYAREATKPDLFTVDKFLLDDIKKPVNDFRDKDVFKFRSFNAERIELARASETTAYEKGKAEGATEEKWRQVVPAKKEIDTGKLDTVLSRFSNLRVKNFPDAKTKVRFDAPTLTVSVRFDSGKQERVIFARSGNNVYASREGDPGPVEIEATEFNDAIKALDELLAAPPPKPSS